MPSLCDFSEPLHRFFQFLLQNRIRLREAINDKLGPSKILPPSILIPVRWWARQYAPKVRQLVCQRDGLRPSRLLRGVDDLKALPFFFGQRLVVRHLQDQSGHIRTESLNEFRFSDACILYGVVQQGGDYEVWIGFGESR